jgi:diguanylate cyclase (GGDEF)-like protein
VDEAGISWLPATPQPDFEQAQAVAVELLRDLGCGHWSIVTPSASAAWWSERPSIPLLLSDGSLAAALRLDEDGPIGENDLDAECIERVRGIGSLLASILDGQRRVDAAHQRAERAEEDSLTDPLTGVSNSRSWWQALRKEVARGTRHDESVVVAVIDLDGFKGVNDREGHLAGDLLLRMTARALRAAVRDEDLVARIGGDEFGILAVDFSAPLPDSLIQRLRRRLEEHDIRASVGAVVHHPGDDLKKSYARADEAMYADKRSRRAT